MSNTEELLAQIEALRAEVEALRARVDRSATALPTLEPAAAAGPSQAAESAPSRRHLFKYAAAGIGGVGLAQLAGAAPAVAGNGDPVILGSVSNTATAATGVAVTGSTAAYGFACTDNGAGSIPVPSALFGHARGFGGSTNFSAAVVGFAEQDSFYGLYGDSVRCGVYGKARGPAGNGWPGVLGEGNGDGVRGSGVVGVRGRGSAVGVSGHSFSKTAPALRASTDSGLLALDSVQVAPPTTGSYRRGDVLNDRGSTGLWVCVKSGTPGSWRKLAGATSAGALHVLDGKRVYDSRSSGGRLGARKTRTITIPSSLVPAGTTAVSYVLTVLSTTGSGSLVMYPTGRPRPGISSIVWYGANQKQSSSLVTGLSTTRKLTAYASAGSTHFLIDVIGYYR